MCVNRNRGLWSLGTKWLVCDRPNDLTLGNDYMTWKFLHDHAGPDFPVVKEMRRLNDPKDPIQITLISRTQGKLLGSLVDILRKLRRFTAPLPPNVNGDQLYDCVLCLCKGFRPPTCFKIGFTEDEWLQNMSEHLRSGLSSIHKTRDPKMIEEKLQAIKDDFPRGGPYVSTHGDLHVDNIIVKHDKIEAIIDWETSGYFPWWAERINAGRFASRGVDLFDGVWARVHPDLGDEAFAVTLKKLEPLQNAVEAAPQSHKSTRPVLWRPRFCKCRPFGGMISGSDLGSPDEHIELDWRASLAGEEA
ncbi:hypothetical protein G647_09219 [Cladophialophora carrionii CBS 160.54]|uniref:Aminoglycoside phosphotransferase domain-containing protein n=1 Tax=Cladophialophora carrionii CBS 160.54 TaxID=1279043 RepID=V9CYG2_9EURO|nr:uncharacterized protein G647_09219 [Cladophialophora carrionii CBS 160.54]ETI19386.1 hypothetical protein G647_09219 [Cladophialophora carrionii CBS 160.54]